MKKIRFTFTVEWGQNPDPRSIENRGAQYAMLSISLIEIFLSQHPCPAGY